MSQLKKAIFFKQIDLTGDTIQVNRETVKVEISEYTCFLSRSSKEF